MSRIVSAPFLRMRASTLRRSLLVTGVNHVLRRAPVAPHGAEVEAQVAGRHVGERVRPVLEHRLVDGLRLVQVLAPVLGDAREEDVVVAALDDVDGVDLHVAQVLDRRARRLRPVAERRRLVEPLRAEPDAAGALRY